MKVLCRILPGLALFGLLSGCSWMPFSLPFWGEDQPVEAEVGPAPQASAVSKAGVSPEARKNLEAAKKYWTESGECLNPARALALLDKAVKADPLDPAPYLLRSRALSDLGYQDEAFDDVTKAIRMQPTAEAYATRGLICLKQNHPKGAQRDFEYAVRLDPEEPVIYVYRAAGAFLEGRNSDACDDLEKACELGSCLPWERAKNEKVCR